MTQITNDRRELAVLISIVLNHRAMPPVLQERVIDVFAQATHHVETFDNPEGIELYLKAYEHYDPGPVPVGVSI